MTSQATFGYNGQMRQVKVDQQLIQSWDSFKIKVAQHTLQVHRSGKGSGKPALLMLHGHTDHALCWTNLARDLQDKYDCIMPDMVGHGQSTRLKGSRTLHTMVAEISSLIYMLGIQQVQIVGHSMGAQLAAMVAAALPDKVTQVVLEDPPWAMVFSAESFNANSPHVHAWIADIERWKSMSTNAVAREKRAEFDWNDTDLHMFAESRQQSDIALFGGLKWNAIANWQQTLAAVRCPIMLITGNSDKGALISPETAARCLEIQPATTHLHMPQATHHVRRGAHPTVTAAIRDFLI